LIIGEVLRVGLAGWASGFFVTYGRITEIDSTIAMNGSSPAKEPVRSLPRATMIGPMSPAKRRQKQPVVEPHELRTPDQ